MKHLTTLNFIFLLSARVSRAFFVPSAVQRESFYAGAPARSFPVGRLQ